MDECGAVTSMEGLEQAFKFENAHVQELTCKLVGIGAKRKGSKKDWRSSQTLWWKGKSYPRKSEEYQILLDAAYDALMTNTNFQKDLLSTGDAVFTHSIGKNKESDTVLTEREFVSRLHRLKSGKPLCSATGKERLGLK